MMFYVSRKFLIILFLIFCFVCSVFLGRVFSYNDTVSHPFLTANIADVYNANFDKKLSLDEINLLMMGSFEEDTPPRWMNHFYEPSSNNGIWGFMSSKDWAQNPTAQSASNMLLAGGDQTWQKAIDSYVVGNNKAAFKALGHVLHLLEDATVPAHTRLDTHISGDPYEGWVEKNVGMKIHFNISPVNVSNLSDAFYQIASYSNKYFLSEDTLDVGNLNFERADIKLDDGKYRRYGMIKDGPGNIFRGFRIEKTFFSEKYFIDDYVNFDYFNLLGPKAVSYGAGVIDLFFREAEKKKQEQEQQNWWNKMKDWLSNSKSSLLSLVGDSNQQSSGSVGGGDITIDQSALDRLINPQRNQLSDEQDDEASQSGDSSGIISVQSVFVPQITDDQAQTSGLDPVEVGDPGQNDSAQNDDNGQQIVSQNFPPTQLPQDIGQQAQDSDGQTSDDQEQSQESNLNPINNQSAVGSHTPDALNVEEDNIFPETYATSTLFSLGETTATTTAVFEFSSDDASAVFECSLDNMASTPCISPTRYDNLSDGAHEFQVVAIDQNNNQDETPVIINWTVDATPPETILELVDYSLMSIDFSVSWNSSSTNVSFYEIEYKIGTGGRWENWENSASSGQKDFQAAQDNTIYYFRARATDMNNNQSSWMEINAEISLNPVVINEVAWMGTSAAYSSDEWIELYNKTGQDINLSGWTLKTSDSSPNITLSGIIPAHGFYLLERNGDSTISDIAADQIYIGILNNTGEVLELRDGQNNLIDSTPAVSWPAGTVAPDYTTMERVNPFLFGSTRENWAANNGAIINGLAADGATTIKGTPKSQNSRHDSEFSTPTSISQTIIISRDTIWTLKGSPYLLSSGGGHFPTVNAGTTLIIEPGVILKPQNKNYPSLVIKGTLLARGTPGNEIKFTSKENSPAAGDWGTVIFEPESVDSILENVVFEYGGYQTANAYPMVKINQSSVTIKNSTFKDSSGTALGLINSSSGVSDCAFSNVAGGIAIDGVNARPNISNNTLSGQNHSGTGIKIINQASPAISSNTISNFNIAILIESSYPDFSGNLVADNFYNGIFVGDDSVFSQNTIWQSGLTYLLMSNSGDYPTVATGTVLTIEPGTILKPLNKYYTALRVEGELIAEGEAGSPIVFTSFKDDNFGGDSNNDGNASVSDIGGDWRNVVFAAGSRGSFENAYFKYGGFVSGPLGGRDPVRTFEIDSESDVHLGDDVVIE